MNGLNQLNLGQWNQSFLLANCFWGAVASGYLIYGWRQKTVVPLVGGVAMMALSWFTPALTMSIACAAIVLAVWWLKRHGY